MIKKLCKIKIKIERKPWRIYLFGSVERYMGEDSLVVNKNSGEAGCILQLIQCVVSTASPSCSQAVAALWLNLEDNHPEMTAAQWSRCWPAGQPPGAFSARCYPVFSFIVFFNTVHALLWMHVLLKQCFIMAVYRWHTLYSAIKVFVF